MLVLTRRIGEQIVIDGNIRVRVCAIKGGKVRLGISAPPSVPLDRLEVHQRRGESVYARDCWQSTLSGRQPVVHVDLRSVLFVDAAGKKLLIDMVRQGARLLASDCQMKALVAEIETAVGETC